MAELSKIQLNGDVYDKRGKLLSTYDLYTERQKLANIEDFANNYTHPAYTPKEAGFYKFRIDSTGHATDPVAITAEDLADLGAVTDGNYVSGIKGSNEAEYRVGAIEISADNIGLGNVDNTADANKSVLHATTADSSTKATQDGDGNVISETYLKSFTETDPTVPAWAKESTKPSYNFSEIGSKPTTLEGYGITDAVSSSLKGTPNGIATLDENGTVPASQLPSYVDDVVEYDTKDDFPSADNVESGKIYVDKSTNITYRWGGTVYTPIGDSIALGITSSTAFAGDRGKALEDTISGMDLADEAVSGKYISSVSQENGKITVERASLPTSLPSSDVTDVYSADGVVPVSGKAVASAIENLATISTLSTHTSNNDIHITANERTAWNAKQSTVTLGTNTTDSKTLSHGGTFNTIDSITRDDNGHVLQLNTKEITLPSNDNYTLNWDQETSTLSLKKNGGTINSFVIDTSTLKRIRYTITGDGSTTLYTVNKTIEEDTALSVIQVVDSNGETVYPTVTRTLTGYTFRFFSPIPNGEKMYVTVIS